MATAFPFRWYVLPVSLLMASSPVFGDTLFSDDFDDPDGTELPGKLPDIGNPWSQTDGTVLTVQGGSIDTTGAARLAFGHFANPFDGTERLLKMTVDFSLLSQNGGYAGVSLFNGAQELVFVGDLAGDYTSIGMEGAPSLERAVADPQTVGGVVTLTYDFVTGRTRLYAGTDIAGPVLATAVYTSGLSFDRIRLGNGNGGDVGIGSVVIETLPKGPPAVEALTSDAQISRQGEDILLSWDTSFADQVTITPGVVTENEPFGSASVTLSPGDTEFEIVATDTEAGLSATDSLVVRSVVGGPVNYRYIRFNTLKTRDPGAEFVQLAEFEFYDEFDLVVPVAVENPGGVNPVPEEGPASLIDGVLSTKWVDNAKAPLVFDFGTETPGIVDYAFGTAANLPEWDPVQFTMEGSQDGVTWTLIENVTAFDLAIPMVRQSYSDYIPFPGESLIPLPEDFRILDVSVDLEADEVTLSWESSLGSTYRITASEDLIDWSEIIGSGIPGGDGMTTSTASFIESTKVFFRVEQE